MSGESLEHASELVGVPDEFQRLWVPHRMVYVDRGADAFRDECPFCIASSKSDEDGLIVARGQHAYVVMNLYPYNSGHLLVCPYRHIASYDEANEQETHEIATLTQVAMRVLRHTAACDGFNIGMNQGAIAGAGVSEHLHQHIVPRWNQDANFMPIIAKTKALPKLLGEMRQSIAQAWPTAEPSPTEHLG